MQTGAISNDDTCSQLGFQHEQLARGFKQLEKENERTLRRLQEMVVIRDLWRDRAHVAESLLSPAKRASAATRTNQLVRSRQAGEKVNPAIATKDSVGTEGSFLNGILVPLAQAILLLMASFVLLLFTPFPDDFGGSQLRAYLIWQLAAMCENHGIVSSCGAIFFAVLSFIAWLPALDFPSSDATEETRTAALKAAKDGNTFAAVPIFVIIFAIAHVYNKRYNEHLLVTRIDKRSVKHHHHSVWNPQITNKCGQVSNPKVLDFSTAESLPRASSDASRTSTDNSTRPPSSSGNNDSKANVDEQEGQANQVSALSPRMNSHACTFCDISLLHSWDMFPI